MRSRNNVILDLCGGTGGWSHPYQVAGYDVRIIDYNTDVRTYETIDNIHGILAAPPCTHFAGSGAQYWPEKDKDGRTLEALSIVDACIRLVHVHQPDFWCLENPVGRLNRWLGRPVMYFQPHHYGDPYTKKTALWGNFNINMQTDHVDPIRSCLQGSWVQKLGGKSEKTKRLRSITPPGFAKAFFEANP